MDKLEQVELPRGLKNIINVESRKYADALLRGIIAHNVEKFLNEEPMTKAIRRKLHKQTIRLVNSLMAEDTLLVTPSDILSIVEEK
jgi:hypothetical protein